MMTEFLAFMAGGAVVFIAMAAFFVSKCEECKIDLTHRIPSIEGMMYDIEKARGKEEVVADILCGQHSVCCSREEIRRGEFCG